MLAGTGQTPSGGRGDHDHGEPRGSTPAVAGPWHDRAEYEKLVEDLVVTFAPRLFAVVQDYRGDEDGRIAAWGLKFEDHAEIVEVDRGDQFTTTSPEHAVLEFTHRPDITARVLWVADCKRLGSS